MPPWAGQEDLKEALKNTGSAEAAHLLHTAVSGLARSSAGAHGCLWTLGLSGL